VVRVLSFWVRLASGTERICTQKRWVQATGTARVEGGRGAPPSYRLQCCCSR
jgi:hypothetical protein